MKGLSSEAPLHSSVGAKALPMTAFSASGYSYFMAIEVLFFTPKILSLAFADSFFSFYELRTLPSKHIHANPPNKFALSKSNGSANVPCEKWSWST